MNIKKTCSYCGREISVSPSAAFRKNHFCNFLCYGKWQKGKKLSPARLKALIKNRKHGLPNVVCATCHKSFHKHPSAIRDLNFCSMEHKHKYQWPHPGRHFKCFFCGREFSPKRESAKFCSSKCYGLANRKAYIIKKGYKKILQPNHPRADSKGYVFEHIIILEHKLRRSLIEKEESHHIDGNRLNNSPENLTIFENHHLHMGVHSAHSSK